MTDIVLGKRHDYQPSDTGDVSIRAKSLGFSSTEIGELNRLYCLDDLDDSKKIIPHKKPSSKTQN